MICCQFMYSTHAGTSSCLCSFNPVLLRLLGEISLSLLCSYSSRGSALYLDPPLCVGRLTSSVPHPDRTALKEQLLRELWLTQAGGREGFGCGASLRRQRPAWRCTSPRRTVRSPGEVVPGSREPGRGGLHRLPGGAVWRVTCARTQASWWKQQHPYHLMPVSVVRTDSRHLRPSLEFIRQRSESLLFVRRKTKRQEKVSCLFGSCRLFPGLPPG